MRFRIRPKRVGIQYQNHYAADEATALRLARGALRGRGKHPPTDWDLTPTSVIVECTTDEKGRHRPRWSHFATIRPEDA